MDKKNLFVSGFLHRLSTYVELIDKFIDKITKSFKKGQSYYDHINTTKQKYCKHKSLYKLNMSKFCCKECGKVLNLVPEDIALLSELLGVLIVGSIVYFLTKKK
ncbi:MAG: hypothetical protein N2643_05190 [Endomicrobia bacterium]|nr:hypothetical protein [Endomicrobiia bacterium]